MLAYVGRIHNLKDLKDLAHRWEAGPSRLPRGGWLKLHTLHPQSQTLKPKFGTLNPKTPNPISANNNCFVCVKNDREELLTP